MYLFNKNRGVSPVIAAVLLIGLTVTAIAVVYFIVWPMMQSSVDADDISVKYNTGGTLAYDSTTDTTKATYTISNGGGIDVALVSAWQLGASVYTSGTFSATTFAAGQADNVEVTWSDDATGNTSVVFEFSPTDGSDDFNKTWTPG